MSKILKIVPWILSVSVLIIGIVLIVRPNSNRTITAYVDYNSAYGQVLDAVEHNREFILDVRSVAEYKDSHVVGAMNFDVEKLKAEIYPDLDKNQSIYVYCRSGNRSAQATQMLESAGFTNVIDWGSMSDMYDRGAIFQREPIPALEQLKSDLDFSRLPIQGNESAAISINAYFDNLCPYCLQFYHQTEMQLIKEYIDTGKATYFIIDTAYLGTDSINASLATYCANEQEAFWPYRSMMLQQIYQIGSNLIEIEPLTQIASDLNLDVSAFKTCFLEGRYVDLLRAQAKELSQQGIGGTPFFTIGNQYIPGIATIEQFRQIIDSQIN